MGDTPDASAQPSRELRAILIEQLKGMEVRQAVLAALFLGVAALVVVLAVTRPLVGNHASVRTFILTVVVAGSFLLAGLWLTYQAATGGRRHAHLLQVLDHEPNQVARIYGAFLVRVGRSASLRPIPAPEADHMPDRLGGYYAVIALRERSPLGRLLGAQKYVLRIRRDQLLPLLAYLRQLAPTAEGPPEQRRRRSPPASA